ncbi:MAG: rhomboid family intramembrane serine protease [Burkholderiaceae bacterium]|nr:rhomboid family intramembrane serine protease [Microbacteriaceae bacterium]
MSDSGSGNYCYRHPDRQSFILCQRCGRTICPECQTQAPVGFHCPECVREGQARVPKQRSRMLSGARRLSADGAPVVTLSLIGISVVVFLLQLASNGFLDRYAAYYPILTARQPWGMLTSVFLHGSFLHITFNMFSLYIFGRALEPVIGRARFLALYLISGLGGSVAVLLLSPGTGALGASGAIFGLFGAFFVIQRGLGGNGTQLLILVALNLGISFIVPGISWQAHIGGLLTGALVGFILTRTRPIRRQALQKVYLAAVVVGLIAVTVVGYQLTFLA